MQQATVNDAGIEGVSVEMDVGASAVTLSQMEVVVTRQPASACTSGSATLTVTGDYSQETNAALTSTNISAVNTSDNTLPPCGGGPRWGGPPPS